jgi:hypothetical protein
LHYEQVQIADRTHAMHGDDVRVLEIRDRDRFLAKAVHHPFAEEETGRHHFDRDAAIERELSRAKHRGHAAAPQLSVDVEFARERCTQSCDDWPPRRVAFARFWRRR